jgi:hypothetical protein
MTGSLYPAELVFLSRNARPAEASANETLPRVHGHLWVPSPELGGRHILQGHTILVLSWPGTEVIMNEPEWLFRILRERARRRGYSLAQELRAILGLAEDGTGAPPLPPVRLATARTSGSSTWSREEIYGDEGR